MGHLYYRFFELQEHFTSELRPQHKNVMLKHHSEKWIKVHNPLHSVGWVLHPEYQLYDQASNEGVMQDLLDIVDLWGFGPALILM